MVVEIDLLWDDMEVAVVPAAEAEVVVVVVVVAVTVVVGSMVFLVVLSIEVHPAILDLIIL